MSTSPTDPKPEVIHRLDALRNGTIDRDPDKDTVTTWADGFGLWHARISCASHGYGNAGQYSLDRNWSRLRALARRAVRRELAARDVWPDYRLRLAVNHVASYGDGVIYGIEFVEASK